MSISQQKISDQNSIIKIELKKEEYEKTVLDGVKKIAKQVTLKGFRPGMAPLGLVKKMHGNAVLVEEVNKILNSKIFSFIEDNKLDVLGQPMPAKDQPYLDLSIDKIEDVSFSYELGIAPVVNFDSLKKGTFTKYLVQVEDKMIDEEVERLKKRFASYEYPETVVDNDILMFTIEELDADGNVKEDGVSTTNSIMLDMLKADKKDAFLQLKKHDSLTVNMWDTIDRDKESTIKHILNVKEPATIIDSVGDNFKLTLNNITRSVPAELNEAFFIKVYGEDGVKTEQAMRDQIKGDLENYFSGQADSYLINDLHKYLVDNTDLPLPDDFLKRWIKAANEKEITDEQIENDYPQFSKQIRWNLIVKKVVNEQKLEVTKFEIENYVRAQLTQQLYGYGMQNFGDDWLDGFVAKQMLDKKYVGQMEERILDDKSLQFLKTQVSLKEEKISFDDFKNKVESAK